MSPAKLSRNLERMRAIAAAASELERRGTCWAEWARERELSLQAVRNVLKGRSPALRGESRRVADLMIHEARPPAGLGPMGRIRDLELLADRLDSRLGKLESSVVALRAAVFHGEAA